jgi:hypothetical protein
MLERMWGKRNTLLVGLQISVNDMENNIEVPQKTKNRTTADTTPGHTS